MLTKFKDKFNDFFLILAKPIIRSKVPPNIVTVAGFLFSLCFLFLSLTKPPLYDVFLLVTFSLSAIMDGIDGAIARLTKKASPKGAFFDSVTDRIVDSIYVFSLFSLGIFTIEEMFVLLVGNLMISYTRARAESLGLSLASVGIAERAERIIITLVILLSYIFQLPDIVILAFKMVYMGIVYVTLLQRIYYSMKHLK